MQYFLKASAGEPIRPAPAGAMPPPTVVASTVANVGTSLPSAPSTAQANSPAALANATTDPYWDKVSLLLTGDDLLDKSSVGNVVTVVGDTKVDTSVFQYGTGSIKFDGAGDYLSIPNNPNLSLGAGDFTFECWVFPSALGAALANQQVIFGGGSSNISISVYSGNVQIAQSWVAGLASFSSSSIVNGSWAHVAVVRLNSVIKCFVNGVQAGTDLANSTNFSSSQSAIIGSNDNNSPGYYFNGYLDDLRITKGVARYTQDFVPPMRALPVGT